VLTNFRRAARVLITSPGVSALIIAVLAVGIGANTAMFSIIYGVLLKPLPYSDSSQLVVIQSDPLTYAASPCCCLSSSALPRMCRRAAPRASIGSSRSGQSKSTC
jgi:hypothetical protein